MNMKLFDCGKIVVTYKVNETVPHELVSKMLDRHLSGDWGLVEDDDIRMNEQSVKTGNDSILSLYETQYGDIYIITEEDRTTTTVLFVEEY